LRDPCWRDGNAEGLAAAREYDELKQRHARSEQALAAAKADLADIKAAAERESERRRESLHAIQAAAGDAEVAQGQRERRLEELGGPGPELARQQIS